MGVQVCRCACSGLKWLTSGSIEILSWTELEAGELDQST